ncbi:MAG: zinc ribbon domain-containing protein [Candidatus Omnitrophica bacterium]|nr:zinc ribbon domain-containing protein [Candidatus Omnitrophota bacterium]
MPIFTYQCNKCMEKFDVLVGMSQDKPDLKCPKCKSSDLAKQFAPFRVSGSSDRGSSKCSSCSGGNCSGCH